jgi:hypothetical protein
MKARSRMLAVCSLLASAPPLVSCTKNVSRVETARLSAENPTAFVFDASPAQAHDRIIEALRASDAPNAIFGERNLPGDDTQYAGSFSVEDAREPVFGRDVLSRRGNEFDVYAHTYGDPLWASPVYRGSRGVLPFVAAFHVHLIPRGEDRTEVEVRVVHPEIINGLEWGLGSCGPGYFWRHRRVAPTTVEEYALLRYIGRSLGEKAMPEMILPD